MKRSYVHRWLRSADGLGGRGRQPGLPGALAAAVGMLALVGTVGCSPRPHSVTCPASRLVAVGPPQSAAPSDRPGKAAEAAVIPIIPLHVSCQQESVRTALISGVHPERLSLQQPSTPFLLSQYRVHPEAYVDVIEPGRVFAPARADSGVPRLVMIGEVHRMVPSLETVALSVRMVPRAPLTVTSLDRGLFENGLTSITIQADDTGLATVHFTATAGTEADVRILGASPMTSGQARWLISITSPVHS